jgi:hypothetical protein
MSKAIIEALVMRVDALEKSDKTTSMRVDALEKTLASQLNVQPKPVDDKKKEKEDKKEKAVAKKEKKAKVDPADAKPKRVTGYILFCNSNRDDVKTKLSIDDEKPKNTEVLNGMLRLRLSLTLTLLNLILTTTTTTTTTTTMMMTTTNE